MGELKYRDPATQEWLTLPTTGPIGPTGPAGGLGPPGGAVNVIGWAYDAEQTTGAVNVLTDILSVSVHIKPDSYYELAVGWRCVSDFGAAGILQYEVSLGGISVPTHGVLSTNGDSGLDMAHYRAWIRKGDWVTDVEADLVLKLRIMTSVASRVIYSPEISCVELTSPSTGGGGGTWADVPLESGVTGAFKYKVSGGVCSVSYDITRAANLLPTEVIATLPVEARPPAQAYLFGDIGGNLGVRSLVRVDTDGTVRTIQETSVANGMSGNGTYGTA